MEKRIVFRFSNSLWGILEINPLAFNTSYRKKNDRRNKDKQTPNRAAHNTWKYIPHTYNTYRYIQIHTDTYQIWTEFFLIVYLIVWSMYCMYQFKIHAHKYTYCVLFNFMYVCVFICMYVYVFFAAKPVGESILTHTYIYMHIHTNFQKNTYT